MSDYEERNDDDSGFYGALNKDSNHENEVAEQAIDKTKKKKIVKRSRKGASHPSKQE